MRDLTVLTDNADGIIFSGYLHSGCLYDSKIGTFRVMRAAPSQILDVDMVYKDEEKHWYFGLREVNKSNYKYIAFPIVEVLN